MTSFNKKHLRPAKCWSLHTTEQKIWLKRKDFFHKYRSIIRRQKISDCIYLSHYFNFCWLSINLDFLILERRDYF